MSHRCCCEGCVACACENCQLKQAPCCLEVTFAGIRNGEGEDGCQACSLLNWGSHDLAHIGVDCGWTNAHVGVCDVTTVNCSIREVDDEYIIQVGFDDIIWEYNFGFVKPWCHTDLYDVDLDLISVGNGDTCLASHATITEAVADENNSGTNDCFSGGVFDSEGIINYTIKIDEGDPTNPNTFKWSTSGGVYWNAIGVAITGEIQTLDNGVTIRFDDLIGHVTGDYWTFMAVKSTCHISIGCPHTFNTPSREDDQITLQLCNCGWAVALGVNCFCMEVTIDELWLKQWELVGVEWIDGEWVEEWVEHCCETSGTFGAVNIGAYWSGSFGGEAGVARLYCDVRLYRDVCTGEYYVHAFLPNQIGGDAYYLMYMSNSLGTSVSMDQLNGLMLWSHGGNFPEDWFCKPLKDSYITICCTETDYDGCRNIYGGFKACW